MGSASKRIKKYRNHYTIPNWLVLVAVATIIMGVSNWGIASAIGACVGAGILICSLMHRYCKRKKREKELADPCDLYYEQRIDNIERNLTLYASNEVQHIHITLKFKTEVYVRFIGISIRDTDDKPVNVIRTLGDWYSNNHLKPDYVREPTGTIDGIWHWTFYDEHQRRLNQRITICIQCVISEPFNGNLRVGISCLETEKEPVLYLPFVIKEKSHNEQKE